MARLKVKLEYRCTAAEETLTEVSPKTFDEVYGLVDKVRRGHKPVYIKARKNDTNEVVTVKTFNNSSNEIQLLKRLNHPNLVCIKEIYGEKFNTYMIMENILECRLLSDYTESRSIFSEPETTNIIRQILEALVYLHDNGIAHLDLRPKNILCTGDQFNTIKVFEHSGLNALEYRQTGIYSVYDHLAPEVLKDESYDHTVDIWAVGVIAYQLLCAFSPFWGNSEPQVYQKIVSIDYDFPSPEWDHISEEAKQFISCILVSNRLKRPSPLEALDLDWITKPWSRRTL